MMAVACAITDSYLEHRDYPGGAPWLFDDNRKGDNPSINGLVTFAFALITYVLPSSIIVHSSNPVAVLVSKTLSQSPCTSLLSLSGHFKRPSSISTRKSGMRKQISLHLLEVGTCPMILVKSNTYFLTRQEP